MRSFRFTGHAKARRGGQPARHAIRWTAGITGLAAAGAIGAATVFSPLPQKPVSPTNNPITPAKVELGKKLFFDPILSSDGTVSCNSCHNVMSNGTDSRQFSAGVGSRLGGRNSPTVWNAVYNSVQFWDGRAADLVEQAKGPLLNPIEMAMPNAKAVEDRVKAIPGYVTEFKKVFGGTNPVSFDNIARAISAYEHTLITPNSPFDRYLNGDKKAMTAEQIRGLGEFQKAGCVTCHSGPNLSGPKMPVGTGFFMKFPLNEESPYVDRYGIMKDPGRFESTHDESDRHMWRVPTLRNVALTAPYFHNGSASTLEEAIRVMGHTQVSRQLTDRQVKEIISFLRALTGQFPGQMMPRLPEAPVRALSILRAAEDSAGRTTPAP